MKIRSKTVIAVSAMAILIFLILHIVATYIIFPSFENLEKNKAEEHVIQAKTALNYALSEMEKNDNDWSAWDDTYHYMQFRNQDYIDNNLMDTTFVNLRLNFFLLINPAGELVYGKSFDLNTNCEIPLTPSLTSLFTSYSLVWNFSSSSKNATSGIILLPEQPLMIVSMPILTSNSEGPIMGALIFGRYLDSAELASLSQLIGDPISIHRFDDPEIQNKPIFAQNSNPSTLSTFVEVSNSTTISGYCLIDDIRSNPAIYLQVDTSRDITRQGNSVMTIFLVFSLLLSIVFGVGTILLLEKSVVKPLNKLTSEIKDLGIVDDQVQLPALFGTDETALLKKAMKDALTQRLAAISELAGMIGHDLRNPLTGIKGSVYYLKGHYSEQMDETGKDMLKTIDDCVEYSNKIINDLLEYSREVKLELTESTPKMLLANTLSMLKVPSSIKLVDGTEDKPVFLVDQAKMSRVFTNLITNAFDAMPKGGSLTVLSKNVGGVVEITFSDSGIGMSEETLNKLWLPLFTTKAKGMGFGLSICRRMVEAHGGKISVKSVEAKGTIFKIMLPSLS
jgi:signal transduction histidine kinase